MDVDIPSFQTKFVPSIVSYFKQLNRISIIVELNLHNLGSETLAIERNDGDNVAVPDTSEETNNGKSIYFSFQQLTQCRCLVACRKYDSPFC